MDKLRDKIVEIPRETANIIVERVRVDGVQPVSRDDFENFRENMQLSITNLINGSLIRNIDRNSDTNEIVGTNNSNLVPQFITGTEDSTL